MSLETGPRIYDFIHEGDISQPQRFSLTELMHGLPDHPNPYTRRGSCLVTGLRKIPKGTTEFDTMVHDYAKNFAESHGWAEEKIEKLARLLGEKPFFEETTNFCAFRYVNTDGRSMADGMPYQGLITDMQWLGVLCFDRREIILIPFGDSRSGPNRKLLYDAYGAKLASLRWQYTGGLSDALAEFHRDKSFTFTLAKHPSNFEEGCQMNDQWMNDMVSLPGDRRVGLVVRSGISLEEALAIISETQT